MSGMDKPRADTSILTRFSSAPEGSNPRTRDVLFPPAVSRPTQ